jgi:hypothetical protein
MNEISTFGLWAVVCGLAAQAAEDRGWRFLMCIWRAAFIVNAVLCVAAIYYRYHGEG